MVESGHKKRGGGGGKEKKLGSGRPNPGPFPTALDNQLKAGSACTMHETEFNHNCKIAHASGILCSGHYGQTTRPFLTQAGDAVHQDRGVNNFLLTFPGACF